MVTRQSRSGAAFGVVGGFPDRANRQVRCQPQTGVPPAERATDRDARAVEM